LSELKAWEALPAHASADELEAFVRTWPNGRFAATALTNAKALEAAAEAKREAAWTTVRSSLDKDDYLNFLRLYPGSSRAHVARKHLDALIAWHDIDQTDPVAIERFLFRERFAELAAFANELRHALILQQRLGRKAKPKAPDKQSVPTTEPPRAAATKAMLAATATRAAPLRGGANLALAQELGVGFGELWPRSKQAFAALGLDTNVYGLEFYDMHVERDWDGDTPVLLISGEVRNIGSDDKIVPPVRIALRDEHARELGDVIHTITDDPLPAGAAAAFDLRIANPPADATDIEATFASFVEPSPG